eukprot:365263-Chlamydomonas_euryale.AAC.22
MTKHALSRLFFFTNLRNSGSSLTDASSGSTCGAHMPANAALPPASTTAPAASAELQGWCATRPCVLSTTLMHTAHLQC